MGQKFGFSVCTTTLNQERKVAKSKLEITKTNWKRAYREYTIQFYLSKHHVKVFRKFLTFSSYFCIVQANFS